MPTAAGSDGTGKLITPIAHPVRGRIRPPGSKSLTNRALIIAALAKGRSTLTGVLDSDDTRVMIESWRRLGVPIQQDLDQKTLVIDGCGGRLPAGEFELYLENSGTSIRFLTAACCLGSGTYRLDGNARMQERPIADLVTALQGFGADLECIAGTGCPPVLIRGRGLAGGRTEVAGDVSSQFLSALLMAVPGARGACEIAVSGELVSLPYVEMTLEVMRAFGVSVEQSDDGRFVCQPQIYRGRDYAIEPDASGASYFFALAAVTGGSVTVEGLSKHSLQGDVEFATALEQMGCTMTWGEQEITVTGGELTGVDIDMNAISDTAQTLACVAVFAQGPTRIRGVKHMRYKETDRVFAVVTELSKLGVRVEEHEDGMTIHPGPMQGAQIHTYHDHRMAMSFALVGLRVPGVTILNPGCTAKTYPDYFQDLERMCGTA